MAAVAPDQQATRDHHTARNLAICTVLGSITLIAIIAIVAIAANGGPDDTPGDRAMSILMTVLPVLSTWVGTVLAHYFSDVSYATAADKSLQLFNLTSAAKLESINVAKVMIPIEKATKLVLDKPSDQYKLKADIIDKLLDRLNRLPILDTQQGRVTAIAHRSTLDRFLSDFKYGAAPHDKPENLTLKDVLDDPAVGKLLAGAFATVDRDASLASAKREMDAIPGCSDVFVTEDGKRAGKVLGWVTNVIIAEHSKV